MSVTCLTMIQLYTRIHAALSNSLIFHVHRRPHWFYPRCRSLASTLHAGHWAAWTNQGWWEQCFVSHIYGFLPKLDFSELSTQFQSCRSMQVHIYLLSSTSTAMEIAICIDLCCSLSIMQPLQLPLKLACRESQAAQCLHLSPLSPWLKGDRRLIISRSPEVQIAQDGKLWTDIYAKQRWEGHSNKGLWEKNWTKILQKNMKTIRIVESKEMEEFNEISVTRGCICQKWIAK